MRRDFRPPCSSRRYTHGKDLMSGIVRLYLSSATQGHNTLYPQVSRENYKTTGLTIGADLLCRQKLLSTWLELIIDGRTDSADFWSRLVLHFSFSHYSLCHENGYTLWHFLFSLQSLHWKCYHFWFFQFLHSYNYFLIIYSLFQCLYKKISIGGIW